ncbi:hypothetical protein [Dapis sp. BLCC M172]|uniref:hypothetical protein n=1 Tax=Dapis sp. BLCC M172 TaxID=2975281 RepID=UPI003CE6EB6C
MTLLNLILISSNTKTTFDIFPIYLLPTQITKIRYVFSAALYADVAEIFTSVIISPIMF